MKKVSVIIPVYNMEKYLRECLDSVISQSLKEIEIIAINDGSKDASLDILQEYASKDPRIRIIDKENAGVGAARNDGIKAAEGEFVAFMDPDDRYASTDALLHCYEAAVKEEVSIAGGGLLYLLDDGTLKKEEATNEKTESITGLIDYRDYQYDYGYTRFIYRRSMLVVNDIFFPLYSRFQDPPFFVKAMIAAGKFFLIDEPVYVYRQLYGKSKYTLKKTFDFLKGVIDNLNISRENDLVKLHYITANRLDREGSFMVAKNLFSENRDELLFNMIKASSKVDAEWLRDNGYPEMYPFVPELFEYTADTTEKYEKLRSNKALQILKEAANKLRK